MGLIHRECLRGAVGRRPAPCPARRGHAIQVTRVISGVTAGEGATRVVSPLAVPALRRALLAIAPVAPLTAALVLWSLSLLAIDVDLLGEYGLLRELPLAWYVALGALVLGAATAASARRPTGWVIAAYVAAVVIVVYATVPLVAEAPRFAWTYKHIGVTRLTGLEGGSSPPSTSTAAGPDSSPWRLCSRSSQATQPGVLRGVD